MKAKLALAMGLCLAASSAMAQRQVAHVTQTYAGFAQQSQGMFDFTIQARVKRAAEADALSKCTQAQAENCQIRADTRVSCVPQVMMSRLLICRGDANATGKTIVPSIEILTQRVQSASCTTDQQLRQSLARMYYRPESTGGDRNLVTTLLKVLNKRCGARPLSNNTQMASRQ